MKLYISSYKLGEEIDTLQQMFPEQPVIAYIPNALDFENCDMEWRRDHIDVDTAGLEDLGFTVEPLDLRTYFGDETGLRKALKEFDGVWVSGGNVFILRQAMALSGLDKTLRRFVAADAEFVYGGYSAAGCVLSPTLEAYQIVDDATQTPYKGMDNVMWEGLGILDYVFLPHYDSDHDESAEIEQEIQYCIEHKFLFKAFQDGEVLIKK